MVTVDKVFVVLHQAELGLNRSTHDQAGHINQGIDGAFQERKHLLALKIDKQTTFDKVRRATDWNLSWRNGQSKDYSHAVQVILFSLVQRGTQDTKLVSSQQQYLTYRDKAQLSLNAIQIMTKLQGTTEQCDTF